MITAFQEFSRKHYQWLFSILLVVIIVSFVFAYSPAADLAKNKGGWGKQNLFFGYDLNDNEVVKQLAREASIGVWLKTGYPPFNPESLQTLVYERILEQDFANRMGVPTPSAEQLGDYMTTLAVFQDDSGLFSRAKYDEFAKNFAKEGGDNYLSSQLAERWRLDQVADKLEGAAYYLPESLARESALRSTEYTAAVAVLDKATFPVATVSDEEVKKYFEANAANYKSSEKREGVYYSLPAEKFVARVETPSEEVLKKYFEKVSFKFLKWQVSENGKVTGDTPTAPVFADHKDEVLAMYKNEKAARMAAEVVDEVVQKIYADKIAPNSPAWNELTMAAGLTIQKISPIASGESVDKVPSEAGELLFTLSTVTRAYSGAFQAENAGGFVLLSAVEEAKPLPFEQVKAQAATDAAAQKTQEAFDAAAKQSLAAIGGATSSEQFNKLASDNKMAVQAAQKFTLNAAPEVLQKQINALKGLVAIEKDHTVTSLDNNQAVAVFVSDRETPALTMASEEARQAKNRLAQAYGRMSTLSCLNEWGINQTKN